MKRATSSETAARFLAMRRVRTSVRRQRARAPLPPPVALPPPIRLRPTPEALAARGIIDRRPPGEILDGIFGSVVSRTQNVAVPADWIVYASKISKGRVVRLPLPIDLSRADVERLYAVLLTCVDDEPVPAPPSELVTLDSAKGPIERLVLEDRGAVVVVCRPEEYEAAKRERRKPNCVGFKATDVISRRPYDPAEKSSATESTP